MESYSSEETILVNTDMQFFCFKLNQSLFAMNILSVKEVVDIGNITEIPFTPDFMLGVMNLRGSVIPIVDLQQKIGIGKANYTEDSCIILTEIASGNSSRLIGVVVDGLHEVIELSEDELDVPPSIGSNIDAKYLANVIKSSGGFILLLNFDLILSTEELTKSQG